MVLNRERKVAIFKTFYKYGSKDGAQEKGELQAVGEIKVGAGMASGKEMAQEPEEEGSGGMYRADSCMV